MQVIKFLASSVSGTPSKQNKGPLLLAGALLAGALVPFGVNAQAEAPAEGSGEAVIVANCSSCHGVDLVTANRRSADEWEATVNRMIGNGAVMDDDQYEKVLAYLKANLSTDQK